MDALKKFISKKKTDIKFKGMGPGHKLVGSDVDSSKGGGKSLGSAPAPGTSAGAGSPPESRRTASIPSEEKRQAAAAALARLEKQRKPTEVNEKERLAARQLAFIREQARREIEAEMKLKESGQGAPVEERKSEVDTSDLVNMEDRDIDPANYAVDGVFFKCPLVGGDLGSKELIEERIKEFLRDQPDEELGMISCLMIHSCNRPKEKVNTCVEILCKYIDNIIQNPDNPKVRKIRLANKAYQEKVAVVEGAANFLRAVGFEKTKVKNDDTGELEEIWLFNPVDNDMESAIDHISELRDTLKQTTPIRPELHRNLEVLMPAEVKQRKELPAEFYQVTVQELKREQQLKTELAERELTLRTNAQREKDDLRQQRIYRYCVMRVRFPDGFTLQGTFWAHDKVSELYDFVRQNLITQDLQFSLKMPRGEAIPSTDSTLAENRLPPASIVNFHVENPPSAFASGEISYLKPEILALVKSMK